MKIAFMPSTFLPWVGGAEIQTHNTANKMVELGHEVDIFLLNKVKINNKKYSTIFLNKFLINFVYLIKYYLNLDLSILLKIYFKKICLKNKYQAWHFHSVNFKTLLYIKVLKKLDQKIFITFQGADIQKDYEIKYGYRFDQKYENLLREVLILTDGVFAISENIIRDLSDFSYPLKKIHKIPNSIEIKKMKNLKKNSNNNDKLKIITVARFYEKKKGLDIIEKITKIFLENKFNFEWTLAGRNSKYLLKSNFINQNKSYFNLIDEISNYDEIYFPHSKLIELYKNHNVYVNLARIESFGITIIESLAADLPVISFDTKGANEIVKDKVNGFIINKYDPVVMSNFIMFELNNYLPNIKMDDDEMLMYYDLGVNAKLTLEIYKR